MVNADNARGKTKSDSKHETAKGNDVADSKPADDKMTEMKSSTVEGWLQLLLQQQN